MGFNLRLLIKSMIVALVMIAVMCCITAQSQYTAYGETKTGVIGQSVATIRSGTGATYSTLGYYYYNKSFTITGEKTNAGGTKFVIISYGGKKAYIKASLVNIKSGSSVTYGTTKSAVVTSDTLYVRSGAGSSYTSKGLLHKNDTIKLYGYTVSGSTTWYRIKYNNKTCYISGSYISIDTVYTGIVESTTLKVRTGKSTSYQSLGVLKKNAKFTILASSKNSSGTLYYKLTYGGKTGYVMAKYVSKRHNNIVTYGTSKYIITTESVNARSGAGTNYTLLGTLKKGYYMKVTGYKFTSEGVRWYQTKYNSKTAYISSSYTNLTTISSLSVKVVKATETVNVRSGAGTSYSLMGTLAAKASANLLATKTSSGVKWYKINYNGSTGYICADYASIKTYTSSADEVMTFENYMSNQGFPNSYKPYLRKLHAVHPKWVFKAQKTGINFSTALTAEDKLGRTLIYSSAPASWKSFQSGAYDFTNSKYVSFDSGWVAADESLIAYYLDPRNALTESGIYQFLGHKFDSASQSTATVKKVSAGSFLTKAWPESTYSYYYSAVYAAGKATGMNPNVLAAMIIQEQGYSGTSNLISGNVSGYLGYYNFLNIGAYSTSTMTAVQRGLWYAKGAGTGATSYSRPWNSRYKAIKGGADFYMDNYINEGQDTLYYKKWNVASGSSMLGLHQYMTNVAGAADEASILSGAYADIDTSSVFYIPVYSSIASTVYSKPGTSGNNNNVLKSIKATNSNKDYLSGFSRYTSSYSFTVPNSVSSISLAASAYDSGATVTGTGNKGLSVGANTFNIIVKSTSGQKRTYTVKITRSK